MGIINELKQNYKNGTILIKLIYINIGVFVVVKGISLFYFLFTGNKSDDFFYYWLAVPSNYRELISHPWSIVTYMFMHADIWHILFNLLWLFWFGQIFLQYIDQKKMLQVYLLGGFCGAVFYAVSYHFFPAFEFLRSQSIPLVGASAAIMAIVIAVAAIVPDYSMNLMFIGPVKLKYLAMVTLVIDAVSIPNNNAGGYISHMGGALFGYLFAIRYKNGKDITKGFGIFLESFFSLFKFKKKMKVTYKKPFDDFEYNKQKIDKQKEIDRILDKIAKGGYESLTKEEKDFLFRSSQ
jgi:membrane associated rhomboid family serine protease